MSDANSTVTYRPIEGFPGYEVGDDGSVRSRVRGAERLMKFFPSRRGGYLRVALYRPGRNQHVKKLVHALVLTAFVGPKPRGLECRHLDGNPTNNRLSNLKWGTRKENTDDRARHGKNVRGERQWKAKLDPEKVRSIRAEYATGGTSFPRLAKKYNVQHHSTIMNIVHRKTWKHVV